MKNIYLRIQKIFFALLLCATSQLGLSQADIAGFTFLGLHNEHHYYVSDCEASWQDANIIATEMRGHLPAISDINEYYFLHDWMYNAYFYYYSGVDFYWIGLFDPQDNDEYAWSNGQELTFVTWGDAPTSPDQNWFAMHAVNGDWYLQSEEAQHRYIVEFPTDAPANGPECLSNEWPIICHNGNTFCVSINALQAHLNHGDYLGPCNGCGSPENSAAAPNEGPIMEESSLAERKHAHDEADVYHQSDQRSVPELKVYPNPTTGHVRIQLPVHLEQGTLHIRTLTGQELGFFSVMYDNQITLDLSRYASGVYLIEMQSDDYRWQQKLMKL